MWGSRAGKKKKGIKTVLASKLPSWATGAKFYWQNSGKSLEPTLHSYSDQGKRELMHLDTNSCNSLAETCSQGW